MNRNHVITFIIISIVILIGVFFVIMMANFLSELNTNVIQTDLEQKSDDLNIGGGKDPLVTSNKDIYYSVFDKNDPVRGSQNARLYILEFGDFECPYCEQMAVVLAEALVEFKEDISLVWKDFPNPVHLQARGAALAARCAGEQGKFWEYHDYLFANQDSLSREVYNQIALELDLDLPQFNNCLETEKYIEQVGQGLVDGQKLEVDATPYLFIGNTKVDQAISKEQLAGIIRRELGN